MEVIPKKLFIDASVFIAGTISETGGSFVIFELCQKKGYKAVTSELVLEEVRKNIKSKLAINLLKRFYKLLTSLSLEVYPSPEDIREYEKIIEPKDAHVLASAIESKSDYLITLDQKHFFTDKIKKTKLPVKIVTPKEFITELYEENYGQS